MSLQSSPEIGLILAKEGKDKWVWVIRNLFFAGAFILVFLLQYAGITRKLDLRINMYFFPVKGGAIETSMIVVTNLFGPIIISIGTVLLMVSLLHYRFFLLSKLFAALMICSFLSVLSIKYIVQRMRPFQSSDMIDEFSFPSGHATLSIVFFGFLLWLIHRKINDSQILLFFDVLLPIIIILVGFSRIFLSFHWVTDVIGGYFLGLFWLSLFSGICNRNCFFRVS